MTKGDLLAAAETQFDLLLTTDPNLRYQQNLEGRKLAIIVLPTTNWSDIQQHTAEVMAAVSAIKPGSYVDFHGTGVMSRGGRRKEIFVKVIQPVGVHR